MVQTTQQQALPLTDKELNKRSEYTAIAHLWCNAIGEKAQASHGKNAYVVIESSYEAVSWLQFKAVREAQQWFEELMSDDAEHCAGIDPNEWVICDVEGIDLYDSKDERVARLDHNGEPVILPARTIPTTWRYSDYDEEDWDGKWSGMGWGIEGGWSSLDAPAVKARITAYCLAHGHDALIEEK